MSRFSESAAMVKTQTVYFAYGSNLHLAQMAARCPESRYLGLGRLRDYKWQINTRGFANVIPSIGDCVEGLCYLLSKKDERKLDISEGVPRAYEKHNLQVEVFSPNAFISGRRVREVDERIQQEIILQQLRDNQREQGPEQLDRAWNRSKDFIKITPEYHANTAVRLEALVYVNQVETRDGVPKEEYRGRISSGVRDAIALGVPSDYFDRNIDGPMARRHADIRSPLQTRDDEDRNRGGRADNANLSTRAHHGGSYGFQDPIPEAYPASAHEPLEGSQDFNTVPPVSNYTDDGAAVAVADASHHSQREIHGGDHLEKSGKELKL